MTQVTLWKNVSDAYHDILSGDRSKSWAVFSYEKGSNELKVSATGAGGMSEMAEEFSDGKMQYGFCRFVEPGTKLTKYILVGWCGEGVPENRKGLFSSHLASVARYLHITARSEADLYEDNILRHLANDGIVESEKSISGEKERHGIKSRAVVSATKSKHHKSPSGSWEGIGHGSWKGIGHTDFPKSVPQEPTSKPSTTGSISDNTKFDFTNERVAPDARSSYTPIGRPDIAALRNSITSEEAESLKPSVSKSSYEPVRNVNINALRSIRPSYKQQDRPAGSHSSVAGSRSPVPKLPQKESKAVGGFSKNYGADAGKSPSQVWAERKAKKSLSVGTVSSGDLSDTVTTSYPKHEQEPAEDIERPSVAAIRERFAKQEIQSTMASNASVIKHNTNALHRDWNAHAKIDVEVSNSKRNSHISGSSNPNYDNLPDEIKEEGAVDRKAEPETISRHIPALSTNHGHPSNDSKAESAESAVQTSPPLPPPPAPPEQTTYGDGNRFEEVEEAEFEEPDRHDGQNARLASVVAATSALDNVTPAMPAEENVRTGKMAVVLYSYEKTEENEMDLVEGEIIYNVDDVDEGWWLGSNEDGTRKGLFPMNYVTLLDPIEINPETESTTAVARYGYDAEEDNELSFPEGAKIDHISKVDDNWWTGHYNGQAGLFPANYVEML